MFRSIPFLALLLAAAGVNAGSLDIGSTELRWLPNRAAFDALGIEIMEAERKPLWELASAPDAASKLLSEGGIPRLPADGIPLDGGPVLRWADGQADLHHLTLAPAAGSDDLALVDETGKTWFTLDMGHHDYRAEIPALGIHLLDVRLSTQFAEAIGAPRTAGVYLGSAEVDVRLTARPRLPKGATEPLACESATWPTESGADADLGMIDLPRVDETVSISSRPAGRVIVTPAAEFDNIGTADLPWFQVFTSPTLDSQYCCPAGDGTSCQPYANDQQGLLVWNLYRVEDDRLEQIGRSGVKHAFNSTNTPCEDPSRVGSARIAWVGCRDVYSASTNVRQIYLGNRDRVQAHPVLFDRVGSAYDPDGDDQCDNFDPDPNAFINCLASPAADDFDRRLSVPESDLGRPGARYFMEAWYLVRDDIDIFNSMGFREVAPEFVETGGSGIWTFPFVGGFRNGPVASIAAAEAGFDVARVDTGSGWIDVATRVDPEVGGYRYRIAVMNYDYDAGIDTLSLPLNPSVQVREPLFLDGDEDSGNQWTATGTPELVTWSTGTHPLRWGTMFSFEFESVFPPVAASAMLQATDGSDAFAVQVSLPAPGPDFILGSGFEPRVVP